MPSGTVPGQSRGHLLVIPFRHVPDYFSLTTGEKQAVLALVDVGRSLIEENFTGQATTSALTWARRPARP